MGSVKLDIYKGEYDWHYVNMSNVKSIKGLLKYRYKFDLLLDYKRSWDLVNDTYVYLNNYTEEVLCLYTWIDEVIKKCNLTDVQHEILCRYMNGHNEKDISITYCCSQQSICKTIDNICYKIHKCYLSTYEDWINLNLIKGTYKKCSKCGEIKLASKSYFSPDKRNYDGFHSFCKCCR